MEVTVILILISISTYLLFFWLFKKFRIGQTKKRKYLAIIPAVVVSPAAYYGLVFTLMNFLTYHPQTTFDAIAWELNVEERYQMSHDIIKSELLIGKSKNEVVDLLGPEYSEYDDSLSYYLGFAPGIHIDPEFLYIYFDNGMVVDVKQYSS